MKIVEDNDKSFKVERKDGQIVHIAKTPETEAIYSLCKGGMPGYAGGGLIQELAPLAPLAMLAAPAVMAAFKDGGEVPGKAKVKGDSYKNDTVNAKLSPGEMVIPRSVVAKGPEAIAKFAAEAMAGKHPPHVEKDKKVHADEGAYQLTQQDQDAAYAKYMLDKGFTSDQVVAAMKASQKPGGLEANAGSIPDSAPAPGPTPPPPGAPQDAAPPVSGAAPPPSGTPPEQSFGVMKGDQNASVAPPAGQGETNVDGGGAKPEGTNSGQSGGYNPYAPISQDTTTDSSTTRPEMAKALNDFNGSIQDNYKAQIEAGTRQAELKGAEATAQANTMNEYNTQMHALNEQRNAEINSRLSQIKQASDKFQGMSIDSHRMYGDAQTGNKIMAGVGLLLGAFGQGLTGKESPVPGIIERAIDRDIGVQKANIEKAGKNVDMLSGGLHEYIGATNDMQTALAAEKARQLEMVAKQFEAVAAANSSPIIKAQAMQQSMAFKEKSVQFAGQVHEQVHSKATQTMQPHFEAQNSEQVNKAQSNIQVQAKTEHLMEMISSGAFKPGPLSTRLALLKNKFNMSDAQATDFLQNSAQITDQIIHDIGGAKGLQPQEFTKLQELGANIKNNPEALLKQLQNLHNDATQENAMIATNNAQNRRYPLDLKSMKDAYVKANPHMFSRSIGFQKRGK